MSSGGEEVSREGGYLIFQERDEYLIGASISERPVVPAKRSNIASVVSGTPIFGSLGANPDEIVFVLHGAQVTVRSKARLVDSMTLQGESVRTLPGSAAEQVQYTWIARRVDDNLLPPQE